jgi:Holliday junction resolvase RusA-like endonuclease
MRGISIFVPGQPTSKGRPRFIRSIGRAITPHKTAMAERNLAQWADEAMGDRPLFDEALAVQADFAFLWPKTVTRKRKADPFGAFKTTRSDLDNLAKLLDGLNGVVWTDDARVVLTVARKYYADKPGTTILVTPIAEYVFPAVLPANPNLGLRVAA